MPKDYTRRYKLLSYAEQRNINIGDYIQDLAASQFLPSVDGFISIDSLDKYSEEEVKMIFNGWFMHNPMHWPPSSLITPLFVAFHINILAKDTILSDEGVAYLKRYEPIGCRDIYTRDLLVNKGIDAYFSGCLTLTLGMKYKSKDKNEKIYFVDPYYTMEKTVLNVFRNIIYLFNNYKSISIIAKKQGNSNNRLKQLLSVTSFYREYRKLFSEKTLIDAEYITQQNVKYDLLNDDELRLKCAEELIMKYSKARFVVTSRIHCALPCLGLETPVLYIEDYHQSEASSCRLGGLRELLHIIQWKQNHLDINKNLCLKQDEILGLKNKDSWRALAKNLSSRCRDFIKD